jgi:hypothetical protein
MKNTTDVMLVSLINLASVTEAPDLPAGHTSPLYAVTHVAKIGFEPMPTPRLASNLKGNRTLRTVTGELLFR